MSDTSLLEEMVHRASERQKQGLPVDFNEICPGRPDLVDEVKQMLQDLQDMAFLDPDNKPSGDGYFPVEWLTAIAEKHGYRLHERLGKGGFGEVWKAERPGGFLVALKFLSLRKPQGQRERAALEHVKKLHHGNLLTISASWIKDSTLIIETELAECSLHDRWLAARQQGLPGIPRNELMSYLPGIGDAIGYLHAQNILHRDIKPANILLKGGKVLVADFGLLQVLNESVHPLDRGLTPQFAAPEALRGKFTFQSDQYALAVSYYLLRCGHYPYKLVGGEWPDYSSLNLRGLPLHERLVIGRALAEQPEQRWSNFYYVTGGLPYLTSLNDPDADLDAGVRSTPPDTCTSRQLVVMVLAALSARIRPSLKILGRLSKLILQIFLSIVLSIVVCLVLIRPTVANTPEALRYLYKLNDGFTALLSLLGFGYGIFTLNLACRRVYAYVLWSLGMAVLVGFSSLYFENLDLSDAIGRWLLGFVSAAVFLGVDWLMGGYITMTRRAVSKP